MDSSPSHSNRQLSLQRLGFLLETSELEAAHLNGTCARLFSEPFTPQRAASLRTDELLGERLDAFAARYSRLQDTAGDRLLPTLLSCLGEPVGSVLDNLDRAAKLGLLAVPAEEWLVARALRNRMVHEYIRSPDALAEAVQAAHAMVPMLTAFVSACRDYSRHRKLA